MIRQGGQEQKIAVITGGSRGIGRSTVLHLAEQGVNSIFTYYSNQQEANSLVSAVSAAGAKAVALRLDTGDVSTFEEFSRSLRVAIEGLGSTHFDFLVNNAGNNHSNQSFETTTEEEMDKLYSVHFKGVFLLSQKLLPFIRDGGKIINVSTGRTRIIMPGGAAYGSLKGAVEVLTRYMAKELGPRRISVNTVAPGAVATDFSGGVVRDNPEINKLVAEMTALGRVGLPDDIGAMIASLLSADNRWVNAQRIEVSGGMSI